jgi:hypothetical protein
MSPAQAIERHRDVIIGTAADRGIQLSQAVSDRVRPEYDGSAERSVRGVLGPFADAGSAAELRRARVHRYTDR